MKPHWILVLLTFTTIFSLIGCGPPPPPTILSTNTPPPPPSQIPPSPTVEPTPTKTPKPLGTFHGCIYFEGEPVKGMFQFFNENGNITELTVKVPSGCKTFYLAPGYYEVGGSYWEGPCATEAGCRRASGSESCSFVMEPNEYYECDFEVVLPE